MNLLKKFRQKKTFTREYFEEAICSAVGEPFKKKK